MATRLRGVRILLSGKLEVAKSAAPVERTVVSGRFALDWGKSGRGRESFDGGMTWLPVDVPSYDFAHPARDVASCSAVGCVHESWLRVGWGSVRELPNLVMAPAPKPSRVTLAPARGIALRCEPTGEVTGPPLTTAPPARAKAERPPARAGVLAAPPTPKASSSAKLLPPGSPAPPVARAWTPFRGVVAPLIPAGDVGLQAGTDPAVTMQARLYAWGGRGSEWLRSGHLQARFDDRFDPLGTRSTAISPSPWSDEDRAAEALGLSAGQTFTWSALLDASGLSAVVMSHRGAGRVDLYAAAQGEPLTLWRDADQGSLPPASSAVRVGETWFFLAPGPPQNSSEISLYRVDGAVARRLARFPRVPLPQGEFVPRLVRRASRPGLGLLMLGAPGFDQMVRDWYVLPIDTEVGDLGDPVRLVGSDLEGKVPPRCSPDQDGWLVNTDLSLAPAVRVLDPPSANLSGIELRLRLDPGTVCVDAMAARVDGLREPIRPVRPLSGASGEFSIPLAATDAHSGRRWLLRCGQ